MIYGYFYRPFNKEIPEVENDIKEYVKVNNIELSSIIYDTDDERPMLKALLMTLKKKKNSVLLTDSLYSLSCSTVKLADIIDEFVNKYGIDIELTCKNFKINQENKNIIIPMMYELVKMRKLNISATSKIALQKAKADGKKLGRPFGYTNSKLDKCKSKVIKFINQGLNKSQMARELNVTRETLVRYIKRNNL